MSGQPAAKATLSPPVSSEVRPFNQASLLAAFAALPESNLTQGDGVTFALWSAKDPAAVDVISKDFADSFAAHRNADRYVQLLKSHAAPMGLTSADVPVNFGPYDFNSKSFPIERNFGQMFGSYYNRDELNKGALNHLYVGRYVGQRTMPDGSGLYYGGLPNLSFDNVRRFPTGYALNTDQAEIREKALQQYSLTEHVVFYPVTMSRGSGIDAVMHVTKVILEQRPKGAPTAVPTILMSTDLSS